MSIGWEVKPKVEFSQEIKDKQKVDNALDSLLSFEDNVERLKNLWEMPEAKVVLESLRKLKAKFDEERRGNENLAREELRTWIKELDKKIYLEFLNEKNEFVKVNEARLMETAGLAKSLNISEQLENLPSKTRLTEANKKLSSSATEAFEERFLDDYWRFSAKAKLEEYLKKINSGGKLNEAELEVKRQEFLEELVKKSTAKKPYPSLQELEKHYGELLGWSENLHFLLGKMYIGEMKKSGDNIEKQQKVVAKYRKIKGLDVPDRDLMEKYYAQVGKTEIYKNKELTKLMKKVMQSEENPSSYVHDSADEIALTRRYITYDLEHWKMQEKYNAKLWNIFEAWRLGQKGDRAGALKLLTQDDQKMLANLLSMKIKPSANPKRQKPKVKNLITQTSNFSEESYRYAFSSIAYEIYGWMKNPSETTNKSAKKTDEEIVKNLDKGVINDLMKEIGKKDSRQKDLKKILKGLVDSRTLKERAADEHPMRILDPGNLLKLFLTVWGGSLAVLNLVASREKSLENPYFATGAITAYVGAKELLGHKVWTGKEMNRDFYLINKSKKINPFQNAEQIANEPKPKDVTLHQYINSHPEEIAKLRESLSKWKKKKRKVRDLLKEKKRVLLNPKPEDKKQKHREIYVIHEDFKRDVTKEDKADKAKIWEGNERFLFYQGLVELGITDLISLDSFLGVNKMVKKGEEMGVKIEDVLVGEGEERGKDVEDFEINDIDTFTQATFELVVMAETGWRKDKFIRTIIKPKPWGLASSAYGPAQITKSLAEGYLNRYPHLFSAEEKAYVKRFIQQGNKFLEMGRHSPNDSIYWFWWTGEAYFRTQEGKILYKRMALKIWKQHLINAWGDVIKAAEVWRGRKVSQDPKYFGKIRNGLKEIKKEHDSLRASK